jgi:hypothetical protein
MGCASDRPLIVDDSTVDGRAGHNSKIEPLCIEPKVTSVQRSRVVKFHVALGAFLVMIAAPVVASSDEPAMPTLIDPTSVLDASLRVAPPAAARRPATVPPSARPPRPARGEPTEVTISVDCNGRSCAVSSGLAVEVLSAPPDLRPLP